MYLPVYTGCCDVHDRAPKDCQMCKHHGLLLDERGVDDSDGSVDLYPALPLGSQAADSWKTEVWPGYHAGTGFVVRHSLP